MGDGRLVVEHAAVAVRAQHMAGHHCGIAQIQVLADIVVHVLHGHLGDGLAGIVAGLVDGEVIGGHSGAFGVLVRALGLVADGNAVRADLQTFFRGIGEADGVILTAGRGERHAGAHLVIHGVADVHGAGFHVQILIGLVRVLFRGVRRVLALHVERSQSVGERGLFRGLVRLERRLAADGGRDQRGLEVAVALAIGDQVPALRHIHHMCARRGIGRNRG